MKKKNKNKKVMKVQNYRSDFKILSTNSELDVKPFTQTGPVPGLKAVLDKRYEQLKSFVPMDVNDVLNQVYDKVHGKFDHKANTGVEIGAAISEVFAADMKIERAFADNVVKLDKQLRSTCYSRMFDDFVESTCKGFARKAPRGLYEGVYNKIKNEFERGFGVHNTRCDYWFSDFLFSYLGYMCEDYVMHSEFPHFIADSKVFDIELPSVFPYHRLANCPDCFISVKCGDAYYNDAIRFMNIVEPWGEDHVQISIMDYNYRGAFTGIGHCLPRELYILLYPKTGRIDMMGLISLGPAERFRVNKILISVAYALTDYFKRKDKKAHVVTKEYATSVARDPSTPVALRTYNIRKGESYATMCAPSEKCASKGGTHASPCEHTRRRHQRHYKSGKIVTIEATVINKGKGKPAYRLPVPKN